jgi:hypothetical protein
MSEAFPAMTQGTLPGHYLNRQKTIFINPAAISLEPIIEYGISILLFHIFDLGAKLLRQDHENDMYEAEGLH